MTSIIVFNKQWKQLFTIVYIDTYGFAVDTLGIQHDMRALRNARDEDEPKFTDWV
jgi:hypothetical protein